MRRPIIAALCALLAGCASLDQATAPRISLANVALDAPGLLRQGLLVELRVGNPNNFDLAIDGLSLDLEIDGRPFAEGYSNERMVIPRLAEVPVPIKAASDTFAIIRQIMTLGQGQTIRYRVTGYAYLADGLGSRRVPYEREGALSLFSTAPGGGPFGPAQLVPVPGRN